jgi:mannosyltransferase
MANSARRRPAMDAVRRGAPLLALAILAFVLAFHGLAAKSLDLDEAVSVEHARLGASGLWSVVAGGDPNMGLYYVLLDGWLRIFGDSETAVRSLTAVSAGLAVPVVALLGIRLFGRIAGLVAGLLLALDAFYVQYAQSARAYGLVVLLVALSSYFFVAELQAPSRSHRVGYVVASALAVYAHYFTVLVLVAQLLTLVAVRRRGALTREWLTVGAAVLALCVPAAVFAMRSGTGFISWIVAPDLGDLLNLPVTLTGGSVLAAWALVALGGYAVVRGLGERDRWRVGFVAAWILTPVLLAFAASFVKPVFVDYYLIVTAPALALLAAAGIVRLPGRVAGALVLGGLVVVSAGRLAHWYGQGSGEDYRAAARHIVRSIQATDEVVYSPAVIAKPIAFYERRAGAPRPIARPHPPRIWLVVRDATPGKLRELEHNVTGAYERVPGQPSFHRVLVALYRFRTSN